MRCYSWNVNGIRAAQRKDLLPWDQMSDADVICLQETKAHVEQLDPEIAEPPGWHATYSAGQRKGYSGVAVISRQRPDEVVEGLGVPKFDKEGRVISARFGDLLVISAYFPKSDFEEVRYEYKLAFCRAMRRFLLEHVESGRNVLLMGDYNIAHEPIDLARPKENRNNPGFLPKERAWLSRFLKSGFHDVYRERNPDRDGAYSWWSYRTGAREKNIGWRIDYGNVNHRLLDRVDDARIHPEVLGSDHCPVSVFLS
jgi:exodeoxyribonuclease-3